MAAAGGVVTAAYDVMTVCRVNMNMHKHQCIIMAAGLISGVVSIAK